MDDDDEWTMTMNGDPLPEGFESWTIGKPAVTAAGGLVASQHYLASEVGAQVLRDGGNAVDAAVAAGLAIGTVEPWMSGLGGGGQMMVYQADAGRVWTVDFGMRAPRRLDPADYPLASGQGSDLFAWPAVIDDRNLLGYPSIAVPGYVAGMALALQRFGSRSWSDSVAPAIETAERGMTVDWYATLKIATAARDLARFEASRGVYLPDGFAPAGEWGGAAPRLTLGRLAETLRRLASAGPEDFYQGEIADKLLTDLRQGGNRIEADDLTGHSAAVEVVEAGHTGYRDADIYYAPGLTAGPTLAAALKQLARRLRAADSDAGAGRDAAPDPAAYIAYAETLLDVYRERLARLGDVDGGDLRAPSCTTHLSVIDRHGNLVALTQTLLSVFGSKVVSPRTGILMNNGIMWFDPRPGRPNSLGPGKRPLSNMCPTLALGRAGGGNGDGFALAVGASGGRRIMPAVFQLLSFLIDYRMTLDRAFRQPRLDVSGTDLVTADAALEPAARRALAARFDTRIAQHGVYPALFACPNAVGHNIGCADNSGAAFVPSPWARVGVA